MDIPLIKTIMILHYEFDLNVDELCLSTLGDSKQGFSKRASNDGIEFFITVKVVHSVAFYHTTSPGFEIPEKDCSGFLRMPHKLDKIFQLL